MIYFTWFTCQPFITRRFQSMGQTQTHGALKQTCASLSVHSRCKNRDEQRHRHGAAAARLPWSVQLQVYNGRALLWACCGRCVPISA